MENFLKSIIKFISSYLNHFGDLIFLKISELIQNNYLFWIVIVLCFSGTLVSYIIPEFTYNHLYAKEKFCAGNLGIAIFIHADFAQLIRGIIILIPAMLFTQYLYYWNEFIFFAGIYAFLISICCIPLHKERIGIEPIAYFLIGFCFSYNMHKILFIIMGIVCIRKILRNSAGSGSIIAGAIAGCIYQTYF